MASLVPDHVASKLREEENHLLTLATIVKQRKEELAAAEKELEKAEETFEWNRLQAFAEADEEAVTLGNALDDAIGAFERSLCPPSDFDGTPEAYLETDDCGDLSSVESTLDDILEEISQYRSSDLNNHLERSVAMLLYISRKFQRLLGDCSQSAGAPSSSPNQSSNVSDLKCMRSHVLDCSEYEDMRQSLLDEWADTLTDLTNVGEDSSLMLRILTNKLGSPFDELSKGRQ